MGSGSISPFISASDSIFNVMSVPPGSSSYKEFYNATASFLSVVTASESNISIISKSISIEIYSDNIEVNSASASIEWYAFKS